MERYFLNLRPLEGFSYVFFYFSWDGVCTLSLVSSTMLEVQNSLKTDIPIISDAIAPIVVEGILGSFSAEISIQPKP